MLEHEAVLLCWNHVIMLLAACCCTVLTLIANSTWPGWWLVLNLLLDIDVKQKPMHCRAVARFHPKPSL